MNRERLQRALGYRFSRAELLERALTHRSHGGPHNERLEFLGDSVLNCAIAAELVERFGALDEGELSRLRASLVRQEALHPIALSLSLGDCLRLGEGEMKSGGHTRPSILADALEALFGAIFLDGGFDSAHGVIRQLYGEALIRLDVRKDVKDPKTTLQELLQARRLPLPQYAVVATRGAAHDQQFEVECRVGALEIRTVGTGSSRRGAEQDAARQAVDLIRK